MIALDQPRSASAGERALLERLQTRRQELDARTRELDLRESNAQAAEKKLEIQAAVGKAGEAQSGAPSGAPAGSMAQRKEDIENARFKSVVTMYETMKPKEAAKIFDRLDIKVLLEVASQIKPQRMSEIMAQMTPRRPSGSPSSWPPAAAWTGASARRTCRRSKVARRAGEATSVSNVRHARLVPGNPRLGTK